MTANRKRGPTARIRRRPGPGITGLLLGAVLLAGAAYPAFSQSRVGWSDRPMPFGAVSTQAVEVRVMTFNIRYGTANDGENAWSNRRDQVGEVITRFGPTVVGVQEALAFQLEALDRLLPGYGRVGVGRDDGREAGEFSAIFYDAALLEVVEDGTFWFSESPTEPGSTAWGATIPRICSWARFRDRASGRTFFVFNNHWDHQAQQSRERSAALLLQRIGARVPVADPVIVTGDFNAGEDNPAFLMLLRDSVTELRDTYRTLHASESDVGTFNGFVGTADGPKIDAVLATSDWAVISAGIDRSNSAGRYPSDHFPVTAVLRLDGGARR
jgi:endonuclease/exonuclease/phosphatase family metal-dependent hydrolase